MSEIIMGEILKQNETTPGRCPTLLPPDVTLVQFYLVVVAGGSIAVISIVFNLILLRLFLFNTHLRQSSFFLIVLAIFDVLIAVICLALFTVRILSEFFELLELNFVWHSYAIPLLALSQGAKLSSTCLILFASFERLKGIKEATSFPFTLKQKLLLVALSILIGVSTNWTVIIEYKIETNSNCTDRIGYFDLNPGKIMKNKYFEMIWTFWIRNIIMVFFPFFALFYMNLKIMSALKRQMEEFHEALIFPDFARDMANERGGRIVAATKMLVTVSGSYLIANALNVLITVWEHISPKSLQSEKLFRFHYICADVVSLLTLLSIALRLPIYYWCNNDIRLEFWRSIGMARPEIQEQALDEVKRKVAVQGKRTSLRKDGTTERARIELANHRPSLQREDTIVVSTKHGPVFISSYSTEIFTEVNGSAL